MKYTYIAERPFWRNFHALSSPDKASVRKAWKIFKEDPFAASLGTHKINKLTSRHKRTVYSVVIANDLRAIFTIIGSRVVTLDVGTHKLYQ